jgi:hypothetical protein
MTIFQPKECTMKGSLLTVAGLAAASVLAVGLLSSAGREVGRDD